MIVIFCDKSKNASTRNYNNILIGRRICTIHIMYFITILYSYGDGTPCRRRVARSFNHIVIIHMVGPRTVDYSTKYKNGL